MTSVASKKRTRPPARGRRDAVANELLDRLKTWMADNNAVIVAVLLLVIGVKLIGQAITGFSN
jgi:hypothetical protein